MTPVSPRPRPTREQTILVVDDDAMMRILLERVLEAEGFRVWVATGRQDGRQLLGKLGETLDLLLTDIAMPGGMGTDLADEVRRTLYRARVIYMSRHTPPELLAHGVDVGTTPIIQKPFIPAQLIALVREVLGG